LLAYDPAYAYETTTIVKDGLRRMFANGEDVFYYITLYNENYSMPAMPKGVEAGILRGIYPVRAPLEATAKAKRRVQLFGSGTILRSVLAAQELLAERYGVAADVWSVTSYQQLYREARATERRNRLHPARSPEVPYIAQAIAQHPGPIVAATDYVSEVPSVVARFVGRRFTPLGTNGFGRSDTREALRRFFEVDAATIAVTALWSLVQEGTLDAAVAEKAVRELEVDPEKVDPAVA
jgi:pyruvate dehydrogenase E1 component